MDLSVLLNRGYQVLMDVNLRAPYDLELKEFRQTYGQFDGKPVSAWLGGDHEHRAVFVDETTCIGRCNWQPTLLIAMPQAVEIVSIVHQVPFSWKIYGDVLECRISGQMKRNGSRKLWTHVQSTAFTLSKRSSLRCSSML